MTLYTYVYTSLNSTRFFMLYLYITQFYQISVVFIYNSVQPDCFFMCNLYITQIVFFLSCHCVSLIVSLYFKKHVFTRVLESRFLRIGVKIQEK